MQILSEIDEEEIHIGLIDRLVESSAKLKNIQNGVSDDKVLALLYVRLCHQRCKFEIHFVFFDCPDVPIHETDYLTVTCSPPDQTLVLCWGIQLIQHLLMNSSDPATRD